MLLEEMPRVQQDFRGMLDWDFQGTALLGCKKQEKNVTSRFYNFSQLISLMSSDCIIPPTKEVTSNENPRNSGRSSKLQFKEISLWVVTRNMNKILRKWPLSYKPGFHPFRFYLWGRYLSSLTFQDQYCAVQVPDSKCFVKVRLRFFQFYMGLYFFPYLRTCLAFLVYGQ